MNTLSAEAQALTRLASAAERIASALETGKYAPRTLGDVMNEIAEEREAHLLHIKDQRAADDIPPRRGVSPADLNLLHAKSQRAADIPSSPPGITTVDISDDDRRALTDAIDESESEQRKMILTQIRRSDGFFFYERNNS